MENKPERSIRDNSVSYYNIRVQHITEGGIDLEAQMDKDAWFKRVITDAISTKVNSCSARLSAKITRDGRSIEIIGGVYIMMTVDCNRCLTEFTYENQIPFRILLEPDPREGIEKKSEPVENEEDVSEELDFSFYSGEEIDVGDLVRQNLVTSQPMIYVCSETCLGLCGKCGKNLNTGKCKCRESAGESPFKVLKQFKTR